MDFNFREDDADFSNSYKSIIACDKGYIHIGNDGKCHLDKGNHTPGGHKTTPIASPVSAPAPTAKAPSSLLSSSGVKQFLGTNTGIASWFRTDNSGDSTNGESSSPF